MDNSALTIAHHLLCLGEPAGLLRRVCLVIRVNAAGAAAAILDTAYPS